jgi:hypothetical protein
MNGLGFQRLNAAFSIHHEGWASTRSNSMPHAGGGVFCRFTILSILEARCFHGLLLCRRYVRSDIKFKVAILLHDMTVPLHALRTCPI